MSHKSQLEQSKYRNWVRGGLAYKYLKEGIEGFADDVVQKEHARILGVVKNTSGKACGNCNLVTLQPLHKRKKEPKGLKRCQWDLSKCNCLSETTLCCPNKICDVIMEEILQSHDSKQPAPNWKNTDVHKWYTSPWDIAKCFINAPGYSDKTKAADIDVSGLLNVFINNKKLQSHFSCDITKKNIFKKCLERKNKLFDSPAMEMDDAAVTECIDDIIAILEDPKELAPAVAQKYVPKLRQLKQANYVITLHNEMEICRTALDEITKTITNSVAGDDKSEQSEEKEKGKKSWNPIVGQYGTADIKKKISSLKCMVHNLDGIRQNIQKHLDFVKEKLEFQKKLVSFYKKSYVNTSVSPLKLQENDVNILEVYIDSEMIVKVPKESTDRDPKQSPQKIHNYGNMIYTDRQRNKSVYIEGNVGAGKSTFCKMMVQNWCSSVTLDEDNAGVPKDLVQQKQNQVDTNIKEMERFEFLFFLPLKRMEGFKNITEMIKAVVKAADLTTADFIDRIFEQDSDRCLIVADGLDEWTLPERSSVLPHVAPGLPERGKTNNATMVAFSRPSAKGILNLASSEWDLRLELVGINESNVENLVKKYLSKLNSTEKSKAENTDKSFDKFMEKIKALKHLESCPLLIQQLVWLYCKGYEIGKSHLVVNCHIVNCMLSWSENRGENLGNDYNKAANTKQVQLPISLRKFESFVKQKRYVLILGQVAFESLTAEKSSSTFRRSSFFETDINKLIELGILVEENCYDPTHARTQLSFLHISYLEFFAAVYASCQFGEQQSDTDASVLKTIFQNCKTAADILQLSNLLKMICGLCPFVIKPVSLFISNLLRDENLISHYFEELVFGSSFGRIQELIFSFLSECDTTVRDESKVYIADVYIYESTEMSAINSITQDNVRSFNVFSKSSFNDEIWKWMTQLKHLQYLSMGGVCVIPHDQMTMLCSLIQEASFRCISLFSVRCQQFDCSVHSIDLSKHDRLQKLMIWGCGSIKISNINTEHLETIKLDRTKTLDIGFLQNARCLSKLELGCNLKGMIRLTYNRQHDSVVHTLQQLQTLKLLDADIDENALTVKPEMRNLKLIALSRVKMSLETWHTFVDSLLTLQQSVQVDTNYILSVGSEVDYLEEKKKYVEEKEKLAEFINYTTIKVTQKWVAVRFYFRTRKQ